MSRRWPTGRKPAPTQGVPGSNETAYPVNLSIVPARMPVLFLATIAVVCLLSGESMEGPPALVRGPLEGSAAIDTMALARSGTILATSDATGTIRLWHPENGRSRILAGVHDYATCVAMAPGGTILAVGDINSIVSIWDVASGEKKWSAAEGSGRLWAVAFSPDGTTLASGGSDRCIYLRDMATHRLKARLVGHTGRVATVGFAPDGRTLVSGSQDGTIRCWDAVTSLPRWVIPARSIDAALSVLAVRVSPDGQIVATATNRDPAVRLWVGATGRELASLCGAADSMISMDFTPDGASLVTGDSRGDLTLWDLQSRRPRHSWNAHGGWVTSVAVSADGRTLVSAGDGTVKLWAMSGDERARE